MRTNIVLNDELVREAMRYSQARTKTALVNEALRELIVTRAARLQAESYATDTRAIQARTAALRFRQSVSESVREDRDSR